MSKLINILGQRFGFWLVKGRCCNGKDNKVKWLCVCECGKEKSVSTNSLRSGNSTSCGCNHNPIMINESFGKLKVCSLFYCKEKKNRRDWVCKCSCGNTIVTSTYKLRNNIIRSCGCKNILKKSISQNIIDENNKRILKHIKSIEELKNYIESLLNCLVN